MRPESLAFIFLLSFGPKMLQGQYIPMVAEGKYWIYLNYYITGDEDIRPATGHAITFQGDTMINSVNYKKVYRYNLSGSHPCQYPPCFQFNIPYQAESKALFGFIREDTMQKKIYNLPVFGYAFCDTSEQLIYDFSLGIGDTLNECLYDFIGADPGYPDPLGLVDNIQVINLFGKNRNTLVTTGFQWFGGQDPAQGQILILEGVGLEDNGIVYQPLSELVDFCEDGMGACDLILSTPSIEPNKQIALFPNPTDGIVQISVEKEAIKSIRIYSTIGVFINEFLDTNAINVSNLEAGIYFLEFILENNDRMVKKIVKDN